MIKYWLVDKVHLVLAYGVAGAVYLADEATDCGVEVSTLALALGFDKSGKVPGFVETMAISETFDFRLGLLLEERDELGI
jgi:hypothetical protein